jgi:hypothetical protein
VPTPIIPGEAAAVPMVQSKLKMTASDLADSLGIGKADANTLEAILSKYHSDTPEAEKPALDKDIAAAIKQLLNKSDLVLDVHQKSATLSEIETAATAESLQGANRHVPLALQLAVPFPISKA